MPLLSSGFQWWMLPFLRFPELSLTTQLIALDYRSSPLTDCNKSKSKVEVTIWPTVSRSVHLGVRHPSGTRHHFFFLLEIFFRQLRVCYFVAPSLTRGRVCNLLQLLVLASAVPLGSVSRWTQDHILLSHFLRLPQHGGPDPRIYIPQEQGVPVIPPGTGFPFRRLLRLAGLRWRYSNPPSHGSLAAIVNWPWLELLGTDRVENTSPLLQ
jgi:hypothetical protein